MSNKFNKYFHKYLNLLVAKPLLLVHSTQLIRSVVTIKSPISLPKPNSVRIHKPIVEPLVVVFQLESY